MATVPPDCETQHEAGSGALVRALAGQAPGVRRYLRVLGCAPGRIDDVIQELCVVALERGFEFRGNAAAGAWLRATAKRLFLAQCRSGRRRREVEIADEVWLAQCGETDGSGYVDALRDCLAQVTPEQRELLEAAGDGDSRAELARRFARRPEGIKSALRRLRALLRECVERKLEKERE